MPACAYCLKVRKDLTRDHVIPRARFQGNPLGIRNIALVCAVCNKAKSDYLPSDSLWYDCLVRTAIAPQVIAEIARLGLAPHIKNLAPYSAPRPPKIKAFVPLLNTCAEADDCVLMDLAKVKAAQALKAPLPKRHKQGPGHKARKKERNKRDSVPTLIEGLRTTLHSLRSIQAQKKRRAAAKKRRQAHKSVSPTTAHPLQATFANAPEKWGG